jgi:hypothetical protein
MPWSERKPKLPSARLVAAFRALGCRMILSSIPSQSRPGRANGVIHAPK